ncbi:MAG: hypothetical protein FWF08_10205 [Oscillospiraceae bacterium]|nr:hypothetical protein [Oscillospiraceae bacterium]
MKKKTFFISIAIILITLGTITATMVLSSDENQAREKERESLRQMKEAMSVPDEEFETNTPAKFNNDNLSKKDIVKTFQLNGKQYTATYDHSYNLESLPPDKLTDIYGIQDIYIDDNMTEYEFLYSTDILCGMYLNNNNPLRKSYYEEINEDFTIEIYDKPIITEEEAINIANKFLGKNIDIFSEYKMIDSFFSGMQDDYDITYYRPVSGYKSDDIINIWVTSTGEVYFFAARNLYRYSDVKLSGEAIQTAEEKLNIRLDEQFGQGEYAVMDSYISKDNEGFMVMAYEVEHKAPNNSNPPITMASIFEQRID